MKASDYLDFEPDHQCDYSYSNVKDLLIKIDGDYFSIKVTKKGTRLYNRSGRILFDLEEGKKYTKAEFCEAIKDKEKQIRDEEILNIMNKDPLIGALFEEIKKKHPGAYVKHGSKEYPNMVAIPFVFATVYVGVNDNKYIIKFNSPEVGQDHILSDINDPDIDPISITMKALNYFKKAQDLMGFSE